MSLTGDNKLKKLFPDLNNSQIKVLGSLVNDRLAKGKSIGGGFFSKAIKGITKVADVVTGCKNKKKEWDYKPKSGEKHTIIHKNGCNYISAFTGPGTHVMKGVNELLKAHNNNISLAIQSSSFPSVVSKLGLAHDIKYVIATNSGLSKDEKNAAIKKADEKFIKDSKKAPDQINAKAPSLAILAKLKAENLKVAAGGNRSAGDEKVTPAELKKLQDVLSHLETQGFGASKVRPLRNVKKPTKGGCDDCNDTCGKGKKKRKAGPNPWMSHLAATWKVEKPKGTSYKDTMKIAKKSYK